MPNFFDQFDQAQPALPAASGASEANFFDRFDPSTAPSPKGGILSDIGHGLKIGADVAAQDVRELVGRIPLVGEHVVAGLDKLDALTHGGTSSEELLKGDIASQASMTSPAQQAAGNKRWDTLGEDSAWRDWRSYVGGLAQSAPEQAVMMFPTMRLAKAAYAGSLAKAVAANAEAGIVGTAAAEAAQKAAGMAAAKAATVAGMGIEGPLVGAQASRQVRDDILALSEKDLKDSEALRSLTQGPAGMSFERARKQLAEDSSTKAFVLAAITGGLFSGMGDRILAKAITGQLTGGFAKRAATGALAEGVLEEAPQSAAQQLSQNMAMQDAVPATDLGADVLNQTLGGLAIGGLQGGAQTAVFGHGASPKQKDPAQPDPTITGAGTTDEAIAAFTHATMPRADAENILEKYRAAFKPHTPEQTAEYQDLLIRAHENELGYTLDTAGVHTLNGTPLKVVPPQALPEKSDTGLTRDSYEAAAAFYGATGEKVVVYADPDGKLSDGAVNARATPGVIYISDKTSVDPAVVAGHEADHLAKGTPLQQAYEQAVEEELTPEAMDLARKRHGDKLNDAQLKQEMRADIRGDAMASPVFHGMVIENVRAQLGDAAAEKHATTFLESIANLLQRVRATLTGKTFQTEDGRSLAQAYVKNLERIHQALAAAIADHFLQQGYRPPGAQTNTSQLILARALELQRQKAEVQSIPGFQRTAEHKLALDAAPITAPEGASPQLVSALAAAQKAPFDRTTEERLNLEAVRIGVQASPKSVMLVRNSLLKDQSDADRQAGYKRPFNNPVALANGSRISGFSDPISRTTFYGYDKNGELFSLRADKVDPKTIVSSRDSNRTADAVREAVTAIRPKSDVQASAKQKLEAARAKPTIVNIGLDVGEQKDAITRTAAIAALKLQGVTVLSSKVHKSDTENTLVATLDRPLTPEQAHAVSVTTRQEAIAQYAGGKGDLHGPGRADWIKKYGPFNPEYFLTPDGKRLSVAEGTVAESVDEAASIKSAMALAGGQKFPTGRALKLALQERVLAAAKAAGVDLSQDTPGNRRYLRRMLLKEALGAISSNSNAIGWYDEKVTIALRIVSIFHPEITTSPESKFAFIWALAVTSNGMRVDKNFEMAERAYSAWKTTGSFPAVGEGKAKAKIDAGLELYNNRIAEYGFEKLRDIMLTKTTVKEIKARTGIQPSGESVNELLFGAAILGPKIGNGYFMNLNGEFGQLTMDRWWQRMWGRLTGTLITADNAAVAKARKSFAAIIGLVNQGADAKQVVEEALAFKLSPFNLNEISDVLEKASSQEYIRLLLADTLPMTKQLDARLTEILGAPAPSNRPRVSVGDELRKAALRLWKARDGQKEAPTPADRRLARAVSGQVLEDIQTTHPSATMADFQALMWYPEKRLYDAAGVDESSEEGYEDSEAPDYANAAAKLARKQGVPESRIQQAIEEAKRDVEARKRAGPAGRGDHGVPPQREEPAAGAQFSPRSDRGGPRGGSSLAEAQRAAEAAADGEVGLRGAPTKPLQLTPGDWYVPGPVAAARRAARAYGGTQVKDYVQVDPARAKRIADAFDAMEHTPEDPEVKAAYRAMIDETNAQWQAIKATGLKVEFIRGADPYAETPRLAIADVIDNNHMWVFPTDAGYGDDGDRTAGTAKLDAADNPMLEMTDEVIGGHRLRANDIFRIVHDYFGHIKDGNGFRAGGEENAWRSHSAMYTPLARRAMTSETRGQNSWVNYGPYAEANKTASAADTHYAPQKIGLLPEWVSEEGLQLSPKAPSLEGQSAARINEVIDQVGRDYIAGKLTFDEFSDRTRPLHEAWARAHVREEKITNNGVPKEVFAGFRRIPVGTTIEASHGLKYPEPVRVKVVGTKVMQFNDGLYQLPIAAFPDGERTVLPHNIKEVYAPRGAQFSPKTPEFKRWFGDSKVVDARGEPRVMYHGTQADISAFRRGDGGIFVSASPDFAAKMIRGDAGANVMPVYVRAEQPFDFADAASVSKVVDEIFRTNPTYVMGDGQVALEINKKRTLYTKTVYAEALMQGAWSVLEQPEVLTAVHSLGFDGYWAKEDQVKNLAVFSPEQIKSATGNSGAYGAENTDIRFSPKQAPWVAALPANTQEALRKAGIWAPERTLRQKWDEITPELGLKLRQATLDRFASILSRIGERPYQMLRMASSSDTALWASLHFGQLKLNTAGALEIDKAKKGFIEITKPLKGETERALAWIAGNRAEELSKEDRENLFGSDDISALKSLNAGMMPDGHSRAAVYENFRKAYSDFNSSFLAIAQQSGLISAETAAKLEKQFYVPFFRKADEAGKVIGPHNINNMVNQYAFKKLKGGEGVLNDLLANTMQNWAHILQASLTNAASAETLKQAEKLGIASTRDDLRDDYKESQYLPPEMRKSVFVLKDGKEVHYVVHDPLVMQSLASLEASPLSGPVMKVLGAAKHYLTLGTTLSPVFRVAHTFREQITALATNKGSYNPVKNWIDGFNYTKHDNPMYANMAAGGSFFRMGMNLQDQNASYVKRMIEHDIDPASVLDNPNKILKALKFAWHAYEEGGERSDSITRANLYHQTYAAEIAKGSTPDEAHFQASYVARNNMDYGLRGTSAALRAVTQVVPFMNARLQGLYRLGRAAAADPKRFGIVLGGLALASIGLMLLGRGDPEWEKRSEWDKNNFWWVRIGDKAFRLWKPFEAGAIATVAERALETALNGFDPESRERFAKQLGALVFSQLSLNPFPQALFPMLELWANKNVFTGQQIESERDRNLSTANRIGPNTSATARLLGKAGVLSPEQIDFAVNAYLGWVGTHVMATADMALRPAMDLPSQATRRLDDYVGLGTVLKDLPANQARQVEQFYDHFKSVQEAFGDMRAAQATGNAALARELAQSPDAKLHPLYQKTMADMGKINQRLRLVEASSAEPDVKRREIDRLSQLKIEMARVAEGRRNSLLMQ